MRGQERVIQVKLFGSPFLLRTLLFSVSMEENYKSPLSESCLDALSLCPFPFPLFPLRGQEGTSSPTNAQLDWQVGDKPKQPTGRQRDQTLCRSFLLARHPFSETSGFKGIIHFTV